MRAAFPEWYPLDADAVRKTVAGGTIALDANVLLQLYRLGNDEREAVLKVFRHPDVRSRLWAPYQAALEYQRNRLKVARDQGEAYDAVSAQVTKSLNVLNDVIEQKIKDKDIRQRMKDAIEVALRPISELVVELRSEHVVDSDEVRRADPIRNEIDNLLTDSGQVGPKPSDQELTKRIADSKSRYAKLTPPGYSDATGPNAKKDPEGDYLIWVEILSHVENSGRPMIFVTNDTKEDWYQLDAKKAIAPRTELKLEIAEKTEHHYHQETLEGFLRLVKQHLEIDIADDTLTSVGQIGRAGYLREMDLRLLSDPSTMLVLELLRTSPDFSVGARNTAQNALDLITGKLPYDDYTAKKSLELLEMITSNFDVDVLIDAAERRLHDHDGDLPDTPSDEVFDLFGTDPEEPPRDTLERQARRARQLARKARHEGPDGQSGPSLF